MKKFFTALMLLLLLNFHLAAQNPNTAIFPGAVATDNDLFVASNAASTTLDGSINDSTTTVVLTSGTNFVAPVIIKVDTEVMHCASKASNTLTCTRGDEGTTAASHSSGANVYGYLTAWHHNQIAAEVKAIEANAVKPFPFTIVQQGTSTNSGNVSSFVVTFGVTTAASGNTIFILECIDGNESMTPPAGWTVDINQVQATYGRLVLMHKATASDTSATTVMSMSTPPNAIYFELSGTRSLDAYSVGGTNNVTAATPGAITPVAGAAMFAAACITGNGATYLNHGLPTYWAPFAATSGTNGSRQLVGEVLQYATTATLTTPPLLDWGSILLYSSSGGIATATFSIK
jgi:hypothetical protein